MTTGKFLDSVTAKLTRKEPQLKKKKRHQPPTFEASTRDHVAAAVRRLGVYYNTHTHSDCSPAEETQKLTITK